MTIETYKGLYTMTDVRAANKASGHHWFDADTMRFFGTKIVSGLIMGRYFITSEKPPYGPRMWTIREVKNAQGNIGTIGEFCGHNSARDARDTIDDLIAQ